MQPITRPPPAPVAYGKRAPGLRLTTATAPTWPPMPPPRICWPPARFGPTPCRTTPTAAAASPWKPPRAGTPGRCSANTGRRMTPPRSCDHGRASRPHRPRSAAPGGRGTPPTPAGPAAAPHLMPNPSTRPPRRVLFCQRGAQSPASGCGPAWGAPAAACRPTWCRAFRHVVSRFSHPTNTRQPSRAFWTVCPHRPKGASSGGPQGPPP